MLVTYYAPCMNRVNTYQLSAMHLGLRVSNFSSIESVRLLLHMAQQEAWAWDAMAKGKRRQWLWTCAIHLTVAWHSNSTTIVSLPRTFPQLCGMTISPAENKTWFSFQRSCLISLWLVAVSWEPQLQISQTITPHVLGPPLEPVCHGFVMSTFGIFPHSCRPVRHYGIFVWSVSSFRWVVSFSFLSSKFTHMTINIYSTYIYIIYIRNHKYIYTSK